MKQTRAASLAAMLLAGLALTACSHTFGGRPSTDTPGPYTAPLDAAVQQRVKNGCIDDLKAQASGASPQPGGTHARKVGLLKVAYLGDVKQVELPGKGIGYELGLQVTYAIGNDDPKTIKKLCTINLADSQVVWKFLQ